MTLERCCLCPVLNSTGYLSKNSSHTFTRLLETTEMVLDCMGIDALIPGGKGWKSVIRVGQKFMNQTLSEDKSPDLSCAGSVLARKSPQTIVQASLLGLRGMGRPHQSRGYGCHTASILDCDDDWHLLRRGSHLSTGTQLLHRQLMNAEEGFP